MMKYNGKIRIAELGEHTKVYLPNLEISIYLLYNFLLVNISNYLSGSFG